MNEQGSGGRQLRELLHMAPDGRHIHFWSGLDRDKDTAELVTAIVAAVPDLYNRAGGLVQLRDGDLVGVNFADFRELVGRYVCTERVVNRDGRWVKEHAPFKFAPARRFDASLSGPQPEIDTSEPDARVIEEIYRAPDLLKRLPRVS